MSLFLHYTGRGLQLIGLWLLLVDIAMAGPLGPPPRIFAAGLCAFLLGWWLARRRAAKSP